jgi:hypothetical protein
MPIVHVHYYRDAKGVEWFSKKACREALEVRHPDTFNKPCKVLFKPIDHPDDDPYETPDYYTEPQILQVLLALEFLRAGCGTHSMQDYEMRLRTQTIESELQRLGISITLKHQWLQPRLKKIKETYGIQQTSVEICSSIHSDPEHYLRRAG